MYQDVVAMVKEIKVDNDIFNKAIGVGRAKITLLKIKSEQRSH